jgi:hypothetical protein
MSLGRLQSSFTKFPDRFSFIKSFRVHCPLGAGNVQNLKSVMDDGSLHILHIQGTGNNATSVPLR